MLRITFASAMCAVMLLGCKRPAASAKSQTGLLPPQIIARSRVSDGNPARLDRVMLKAKAGNPITVAFFGGSITFGEGASSPDKSYAAIVNQWWVDRFPKSHITMHNAGVPGTGSGYGVFRLQRDLLAKHPDFVVVEFGVNDKGDLEHAETFEGIIRQLLADPDGPAILLLFLMHHDGTNAQDFQGEIGKHYGLPMVSYRDGLWPEIAAKRLAWSDITKDPIHPNDRGHAAAAVFITSMLQQALDRLPSAAPAIPADIPAPVYTPLFSHTEYLPAEALKPISNQGWQLDSGSHCWFSDVPGTVIEFEASGKEVSLLYPKVTPKAGCMRVVVDDDDVSSWDSWFEGSWQGYIQSDEIWRGSTDESHRIRISVLPTRNSASHGYECRIAGFGIAR